MSEPENFLSRWSRRKIEAEQKDESSPADIATPETKALEQASPDAAAAKPREGEKNEQPEFDISTLPSIESITEATDVRVFLQKGVPADLTRAALRRAWAADPTIRDFIGIAENQYDFATGSDLPGFGALDAGPDEIRRMVAEVFGEGAKRLTETEDETAQTKPEEPEIVSATNAGSSPEQQEVAAASQEQPEPESPATTPAEEMMQRNEVDIATQQNNQDSEYKTSPPRRPHGRALPQ